MARVRQHGWEKIIEAFERSGETQRAFALRRGLSVHTLQSWIYRYRRQYPSSRRRPLAVPRLVEVRVAAATVAAGPLELLLPSGVTVRVAPGTEPAWASALVKALL